MKRIALIVAALAAPMVLTLLLTLTLAGCDDEHRDHFRGDRDRTPERVERSDRDRHEEHRDVDRR